MGSVLSDEQVERYHADGFLKIEGFVDRSRCAELREAANAIVEEFQPNERRTVFTTSEQERISDGDFLASGSGIWCFFEEEAFLPDGSLRQAKQLSINKIGHAMHDLDPKFESFSYTPDLAAAATDIGLSDALALQSMYIFKQPHIGGEVGLLRDGAHRRQLVGREAHTGHADRCREHLDVLDRVPHRRPENRQLAFHGSEAIQRTKGDRRRSPILGPWVRC